MMEQSISSMKEVRQSRGKLTKGKRRDNEWAQQPISHDCAILDFIDCSVVPIKLRLPSEQQSYYKVDINRGD
jgi:hypothetical protein